MDDKVFNLLEKMYSELTTKIDGLNNEMKEGFKQVDTRFAKIEMSIENDIKPKISLCLEELAGVKEKLIEHDIRFDTLETKIESHDTEITFIKKAR